MVAGFMPEPLWLAIPSGTHFLMLALLVSTMLAPLDHRQQPADRGAVPGQLLNEFERRSGALKRRGAQGRACV